MIDSVPLIQNANDAQQINASIIAMKKASRELDEKIVKLNSLNSELDKKIALLDSGLNKEIEDRKEAINSLDVPSVGGSGKYISAISETDGKISATAGEITSSVSSGNSQPVTSGGVADAIAPLQPINSVTSGNLKPVTSGAVFDRLYGYSNIGGIASECWINLGVYSQNNYGGMVKIFLSSVYNNRQSSCREITLCMGWDDIVISELSYDAAGVFDKIRISRSTGMDRYRIFVHYTPNVGNNVYYSVFTSTIQVIEPTLAVGDPTVFNWTKEFSLGIKGFYVNGIKIN